MDGYKECARLWKHESFRNFIAEHQKKYEINLLDEQIHQLTEKRKYITTQVFTYELNQNAKTLKTILPWKNVNDLVKEYKKKYSSKKTVSSILRFMNELIS